jgi:hypothetical protein
MKAASMNSQALSERSVDLLARWQRGSLWIGIVALVLCVLIAPLAPIVFFRAYLAAFLFCLGISLGSMALLMAYHLTGGSWGFLVRRILEASMAALPLVAVFFLPIAWSIAYLYVWARPAAVAASPKLQYQQFYLTPTYFWIRAAVYFILWIVISRCLLRWSREEDETANADFAWKSRQLSAIGAVAYGISLHFAAVDWGMSLVPVFHSTIWGPLFAAGQLLSALAFALIVLAGFIARPPINAAASLKARDDLGSLLLTLLVLWAYMVWFQFMLIWIANLPVDVIWYVPRTTWGWKAVMWAIFWLHFIVPFVLLLMRPIKRNSTAVAAIAGLILFMQLVFMHYEVAGDLSTEPLAWSWLFLLVSLGMGGIWFSCVLRRLSRRPLLPLNDENRASALHLLRLDEEEAARETVMANG